MSVTRRQFLKTTALCGGVVAAPIVARASVRGANEEIRVGVIGLGIRGAGAHVPGFNDVPGARVVAVCDADMSRADSVAQSIKDKYGRAVKKYQDLRALIADREIDVVGIATLQHWHALATCWSCQAGKDVYVEKPASHYMREGLLMQAAAQRSGRIVQVGTQRRSQVSVKRIIHWLKDQPLGKSLYAVSGASKPRSSLGKRSTPLPIPDHVDYDLWCGPARKVDLFRNRLQYDGNFDFNTGDGDSCNQGTHEIDLARWALGESQLPGRVISIGSRQAFVDDSADVARIQLSCYEFDSAPVFQWTSNLRHAEGRGSPQYGGYGTTTVLYCEGGACNLLGNVAYDREGKSIPIEVPDDIEAQLGSGDHFQNFIDSVRNRDRGNLTADIVEGTLSTNVTHSGNISFRTGVGMRIEAIRERIKGMHPKFTAMFEWLVTHCEANKVDLSGEQLVCGPMLEIDQANQTFKGNESANRLARGFVRKGWEFPAI